MDVKHPVLDFKPCCTFFIRLVQIQSGKIRHFMRMKVSEDEAKKRITRLVTETVGTEQLQGHAAIRIYLHR